MKNFIVFTTVVLSGFSALAGIPSDLQDLIPSGKNTASLSGKTQDNKPCQVELSASNTSFSAALSVLKSNGDLDSRRSGAFQIGFGYTLQSISSQNNIVSAVSFHKAEEQYSSDARTTLHVAKNQGAIQAVQVIVEEKGFFKFKTVIKETCSIK
ncbi:MAG: hypothetical protein JSU04_19155 [Bdellovibrionales bacterium]|nr:hypothetical protein [Bdellovibrionales bacterium]